MRARTQRLRIVGLTGALLAAAGALAFVGLRDNANLFYTPTRLAELGGPREGLAGKVGGLVETGSLAYSGETEIRFQVVDEAHSITVVYGGVTPDLFKEGAGVVAEGVFNAEGVFVARQLLAKHDETYVPRELQHMDRPDA